MMKKEHPVNLLLLAVKLMSLKKKIRGWRKHLSINYTNSFNSNKDGGGTEDK